MDPLILRIYRGKTNPDDDDDGKDKKDKNYSLAKKF
jgi:hypothetical protein